MSRLANWVVRLPRVGKSVGHGWWNEPLGIRASTGRLSVQDSWANRSPRMALTTVMLTLWLCRLCIMLQMIEAVNGRWGSMCSYLCGSDDWSTPLMQAAHVIKTLHTLDVQYSDQCMAMTTTPRLVSFGEEEATFVSARGKILGPGPESSWLRVLRRDLQSLWGEGSMSWWFVNASIHPVPPA